MDDITSSGPIKDSSGKDTWVIVHWGNIHILFTMHSNQLVEICRGSMARYYFLNDLWMPESVYKRVCQKATADFQANRVTKDAAVEGEKEYVCIA